MTTKQEIAKKHRHSFKTKSRFRLSFINENRFNEVWTVKFTRTKIVIASALLLTAIACTVATIIVFTPIRTLLPGYLKDDQRRENIVNTMRIDSLTTRLNIDRAYIGNIIGIISGTTPDSARMANEAMQPGSPDSLLQPTDREKEFVRRFEEEERFNLSVLSPMAAEGITFSPPLTGAIEREAESSRTKIALLASPSSNIYAIYDGTVVVSYPTMGHGNNIILQHPNGFLSKYSGISTLFVSAGDRLTNGAVIGITSGDSANAASPVFFELWNKGAALDPREYISF